MNFKDKLLEQLNREDLSDNESKVNAIIEAVGDFIPKGTYNDLSKVKRNIEIERDNALNELNQYKQSRQSIEEQNTERLKDIIKRAEERERNASIRENSADAKEILIGAGLSKEEIESNSFLANIVNEDRDATISRANSLASLLKAQKTKVENEVRNSYYNDNPTPPASDKHNDDVVTKEQLAKMTYSEEIAFAEQNPALYAELTKN